MRCPICGKESFTTNLECSEHFLKITDSSGGLIAYSVMIKLSDNTYQTKMIYIVDGAEC